MITLGLGNDLGRRHKADHFLLIIMSLLLAVGMVVMFSISPALVAPGSSSPLVYYVGRQAVAIAIGLVLFLACSYLPIQSWRKLSKSLLIVSLIVSVVTVIIGGIGNRWLQLSGISFQPAEMAKFSIIIALASFLTLRAERRELGDYDRTLKPIGYLLGLIAVVIVLAQKDLGSAAVLVAIIVMMIFIAGVPIKKLTKIGLVVGIGLVLAIISTPYRRDRFLNFLNPERDCSGSGYHVCQSLISIGSGGVVGLGLGNSIQAHGYIPEPATDSIFAIYAEKFGFIGSLLLMVLFGLLIIRLIKHMDHAPNLELRLLMSGITAWIGVQTIINIGAMMGLLPLKGITLPFISYGGSSIMFVMAAMGVAYNVSRYSLARKQVVYETQESQRTALRASGRGNRRPYYANVVRRSVN